jgi:hypothetical protein
MTLNLLRPKGVKNDLLRVGGHSDGGYLVPDDFVGIAALFSPGVAETADFEAFFLNKGIPCHLLDASVEGPPFRHDLLTFDKRFLGPTTTGKFVSLRDWVMSQPSDGDLILQMDIEGAEWEVLACLDDALLNRFRIIVVELHGLASRLEKQNSFHSNRAAISNLTRNHVPVHFHANNCCGAKRIFGRNVPEVAEITLVRRGQPYVKRGPAHLPHHLDRLNVPGAPVRTPW